MFEKKKKEKKKHTRKSALPYQVPVALQRQGTQVTQKIRAGVIISHTPVQVQGSVLFGSRGEITAREALAKQARLEVPWANMFAP